MKLIIDVPEKVYKNAREDMLFGSGLIANAIKNGTPIEQEPCDDAVSRQAVLESIDVKAWEFCDYLIRNGRNDELKPVSHFAGNLRECVGEDLPPVSPQPCEDCISREAVLELVADYDLSMGQVVKGIHALPSVSAQPNKWISVSERLPEVGSQVLVCYEFKKERYVYISDFYGDGKFHGLDDEYLTTEGRKYRKAVAWLPLPTPPNKSEIQTEAEGSNKE